MSQTNDTTKNRANTLDDEARVKVLSPSMLVFKRFIRNKLAIVGMIILIFMFLFSFAGGLLSPYTQSQVFRKEDAILKDYASATFNKEMRYTVAEGADFPLAAQAKFVLARNNGETSFDNAGVNYTLTKVSDDFYRISAFEPVGSVLALKGKFAYSGGAENMPAEWQAALEAANAAGENTFEFDGVAYTMTKAGKGLSIGSASDVSIATMNIYTAYAAEQNDFVNGIAFKTAAETAIAGGQSSFEFDSATYEVSVDDAGAVVSLNGEPFAVANDLIVNPVGHSDFMSVDFKNAVNDAIVSKASTFEFDGVEYTVNLVKETYAVQAETVTELIDMYAYPSAKHLLGTDQNGMDVLTRLMYGGRISLLVGFVVVIIEMLIGIVVGGVSGYFGGWVDNLLMRFVDLFNCIPYWPIMIITGAVMDTMDVNAYIRIFLLMLIMGLMGWTGPARVVRGQILALREQDFMVATEATGIRVSKRIFRHLVPNVMPLLIVQATMGLGSIIITEATLSFLGLGVKYPIASWGTIINSATNIYVMTNYWFMWIPAGLLILLTVLGFNFVGDGLRDAFDPKMKR